MLIAVRMAAGRLFDERDRLRLDRLAGDEQANKLIG